MKIIVTIKQVPFVDKIRFDSQTRRLIREGVESEINPFDKRALTQAIQLKNTFGSNRVQVTVLTMGPPQAKDALVEALAMGADRAVHLLGREFAGSDTLATARTLALACRKIGFDLILCGKYSTDAETGQVPPMLAEFLDIPQATGVTRLQVDDELKRMVVTREVDDGFETLECPLPALVSAAERLVKPIRVAPGDLEKGRSKPIQVLAPSDLATDFQGFGSAGSPTVVSDIYSIEPARRHRILDAQDDPDVVTRRVVAELVSEGLFAGWKGLAQSSKSISTALATPVNNQEPIKSRAIWVVAELVDGQLRPVTLELLGRATELAERIGGQVAALLIGNRVGTLVETLGAYGADKVYVAESPELAAYSTEKYAAVLAAAIRQEDPYAVLIPSTANGRDLAPRIAARLGIGLTGDCIGLDVDAQGRLVQLKPAFGGNIVAPIVSKTSPAMATIRPGMLSSSSPNPAHRPVVESLTTIAALKDRVRLLSQERTTKSGIDLEDSEVVIGIGMGLGVPANLERVNELAAVLNAKIGATRKVVDAGWLPRQQQIGLTGRSISPRLYVALGISGKFNHVVGVQRAGRILAINKDRQAEIFAQADYGLVGDWERIVPSLTRALLAARDQTLSTGSSK